MKSVNGTIRNFWGRLATHRHGAVAVRSLRSSMNLESLESRQLLAGVPSITEFMAKNDGFFEDGDGNAPDWIEIQNIGDQALDLAGYRLTDDAADLEKWTFPSVTLTPGEYLVVFASGQEVDNYVDAGGNPHANFGLKAEGEYLALVSPQNEVVSEFGTAETTFPPQSSNVSYGIAQRQILIHEESDAAYFVPLSGEVPIWTSPDFDAPANGFVPSRAAMGIETQPDSRNSFSEAIITELPENAHGVFSRMEFNLDDASAVTNLNLRMKIDNGFVAYLNGVKVASQNAPEDPLWFSPAPDRSPPDSQALTFSDFDLTEHVAQLVNGKNVLAIHGLNNLSDRGDFLLVPQLLASVNSPNAKVGYMVSPTPGAENVGDSGVFLGSLGDIEINGQPGFHDEPFTVTISGHEPDVEVRFTTNGTPPTATTGMVYTGDPIQIASTTLLRAAAFKDGHIPSHVETQSYLFLEEIIGQPQDQPGLPTEWLWTEDRNFYPADYEMDPRIVDDPVYGDQILDSLKSLRTISVVMDMDDIFGPEGMHNNTELHGRESEHPMSLEILNPDGSLAFQVDAGIRIHGNFTRHFNVTMKQSFRLTFRGEYGATSLEYPLFPDSPADAFDNVILHAGKIRDDTQLAGNSFGRKTNLDMGHVDAHTTYVHLYLNGLYWGVYNPMERPDGQFAETYLGGLDTDYDSILNNTEAVDGSSRRFGQLVSSRAIRDLNTKEEYEDYLKQVDVDSLIDFLLINQYMAHNEHEFRALVKKEGDADIRFMIWDTDEMALTNVRAREDINTYFASGVYEAIIGHPELSLRYADRIQRHLINDGGALTPDAAQARWESLTQEVRPAIIAESARWGDMRWNNAVPRRLYTLETFDEFGRRVADEYFPGRTDFLLNELKTRYNLVPDAQAPQWNRLGGAVSVGFQLTMDNPNTEGVILYTLDGTDPRQYGGDAATSAVIHDGSPISISQDMVVKARTLVNGEWSPLMEGEFIVVGPDSPFHLRVTELNYHPYEANLVAGLGEAETHNSQFEFVEITNTSSAAINTSGVQLSRGVQFTFPENSSLAAGARVLLVNNQEAFESRYGSGLNIAGEFENDSLSDVQALIELRDASGRQIQSFTYKQIWTPRASGRGSTLELVDSSVSSNDRANWRSSREFGGSPGSPGLGTGSQVTLTEVLANSENNDGDKVEVHNATGSAVDIGNWYVSNSQDNYFQHQIASGTTVPAKGYHVLSQSEFGFDLDGSRGDNLWLVAADGNGKPTEFADQIQFGPSAAGVSVGPGPDNGQTWLPLAQQTFGNANSGLYIGEAIITEVNYAPFDPDGDGRTLRARDFEFVELYNTTNSVVDISGWQLSGDISYDVPEGTTIDAGKTVLVVPFDPQDNRKAPVFRVVLEVGFDVPLIGPYSDLLGDDGGTVRLQRPDQPPADDPTLIPLLYVDQVTYDVTRPWPTDAIGSGNTLTRLAPNTFGDLASSWTSAPASASVVDLVLRVAGDSNGDGLFDQLDLVEVLQAGKYQTGQPASFNEGDWNDDGIFDRLDIVDALQAGNYLASDSATA